MIREYARSETINLWSGTVGLVDTASSGVAIRSDTQSISSHVYFLTVLVAAALATGLLFGS
jgi:hypothetical protein